MARAVNTGPGLKERLRHAARLAPLRWLVRGLIAIAAGLGSAWSVLRTAALFTGPDLPFCHWSVTVKYADRVRCGKGVVIGPKSTIGGGGITLGNNVRISERVIIESAGLDFKQPAPYPHVMRPIVIGDDVWMGARAMVLQGVTIGAGAIIGAGTIVSRDVPAGAVVVSQPPRLRDRASGATYAAKSYAERSAPGEQ